MLWVLYSLLSAFSWATADVFTKKLRVDDYTLLLSRFIFAAPFALPLLFLIKIPELNKTFWIVFFLWIPLEILLWVLYIKAIKISPISLVVPFLSFTPIFLILTSFIMLGELPSLIGAIGILFVVVGVYVLNFQDYKKGYLEPFRSIFKEKGCILMIIVAFIASITANQVKILLQNSSLLFFNIIYFPAIAIPLLILSFFLSKNNFKELKLNFKNLFPIGIFFALMIIFHNFAVRLVIVPYMISIKRTSSIFSVFYGHFLFKEKNIKERLIGSVIMLIGAGFIILG